MTRAATERVITIDTSVDALDWAAIGTSLNDYGNAVLSGMLTPRECDALMDLYQNDDAFRSRVVMERHGFGRGEYKYFAYPLPDIVHSAPHLALPASRTGRQRVECTDEAGRSLPR